MKAGISLEPRFARQEGRIPLIGYALGPENPSTELTAKESFIQLEGFTYLKWKIQEKLSLGVGGRVHQSLDTARLKLSRQFHLVYKFSPQSRIHFSGGTYYQRNWETGRFPRILDVESNQ